MILEGEQTAAPEVIIKPYKRLALKLHQDRNIKYNATEAFQLVCLFLGARLALSLSYRWAEVEL